MYEINDVLKPYYEEIEPEKRLEILNSVPENIESEFLREIYNIRYEKQGQKNIDRWLWHCMCLQMLYGKSSFFRSLRMKEITKILDALRMNDTDEEHKNFLYHEYKNAAKRYLSTCKAANYASRIMGFRQASDDEKVFKACQDIWQMSKGIALKEGIYDKMKIWCDAFRDELMNFSPICREEYERLNMFSNSL